VCCSVLHSNIAVAVWKCSCTVNSRSFFCVLQSIAVFAVWNCSRTANSWSLFCVLQSIAVCCNVSQCFALCCSVELHLHRVQQVFLVCLAVSCSAMCGCNTTNSRVCFCKRALYIRDFILLYMTLYDFMYILPLNNFSSSSLPLLRTHTYSHSHTHTHTHTHPTAGGSTARRTTSQRHGRCCTWNLCYRYGW